MPHDLSKVHPRLVAAVDKIRRTMEAYGHPMVVTASLRSADEQQALYAQGRTTPGRIVTNADGVIRKSQHQAQADGYGHAVDMAFIKPDGTISWDQSHPWWIYGAIAQYEGLTWGGSWKTLKDLPHIEVA